MVPPSAVLGAEGVATLVNALGVSPTQTVWPLPIVFDPVSSFTRRTKLSSLKQPVPLGP